MVKHFKVEWDKLEWKENVQKQNYNCSVGQLTTIFFQITRLEEWMIYVYDVSTQTLVDHSRINIQTEKFQLCFSTYCLLYQMPGAQKMIGLPGRHFTINSSLKLFLLSSLYHCKCFSSIPVCAFEEFILFFSMNMNTSHHNKLQPQFCIQLVWLNFSFTTQLSHVVTLHTLLLFLSRTVWWL